MKGLDICVSPSFPTPLLPISSKPIYEGKLFELRFGHKEIRLHGVSHGWQASGSQLMLCGRLSMCE